MTIPSVEECVKISQTGDFTMIPVTLSLYADQCTPIVLLHRLNAMSYHAFLLESVAGGEQWGRYSFLGFDPIKSIECKNGILRENGENVSGGQDPVDFIRRDLSAYKTPKLGDLPPFTGGYVGFFSYDAVNYFEPAVNIDADDPLNLPDFKLMLFDKIICFDHFSQKMTIIINIKTDDLRTNYKIAKNDCQKLMQIIKTGDQLSTENPITGRFSSNMTKAQFMEKTMKIKEHICNGDIFQAVLSQRFQASFRGSLLNVYRVLRTKNPSPYLYFLNFGDIEIAGASPETLIKVADGTIYVRPIAGTRPRGKSAEEDEALIKELLSDEKECAEHNMLVDLARNDVGKAAKFGTVTVPEYMRVSRFSHVSHITSLVTGELSEKQDSLDAFQSAFPAGTLSGAPKIRAMQLLNEIEGTKRGIYGGAIGYIDFAGNLDFCIAIRTIVKKADEVFIGAGAGIVYDSDPEKEYEETLHKAATVFEALEHASEDLF